ncbi:MAG: hypothetical protein ACFFKA_13385 [Candidatus Thorarchaeota archaeon]
MTITYSILTLLILALSYFSSSLVWFADCELGCLYYYDPLSYPLELSVSVSPLAIYPPIMTLRLNLFGIEILKINGQFGIQSFTETQFIIEHLTLMVMLTIFLINLVSVSISISLLYIVDKRRTGKDLKT